MQVPKSKTNPRHAAPLISLGIISRRCSTNPPSEATPHHCTTLCGKASVSSVTLCYPHLYDSRTAPSKEDGGTLKKGMDARLAPAQDDAVTSDQ
jgi:hypothetical protein